MFNKILIANRGEIACRILKQQNKWELRLSLFFGCGQEPLHVQMADEDQYWTTSAGINRTSI